MGRHKSQNEHAFDTVDFVALASPHRWSAVGDFMADLNGTKNFKLSVDYEALACHGTCGLRPDEAMMQKEKVNRFDLLADKMNWSPSERKNQMWLSNLLGKVARVQWLADQLHETLITGSAPMDDMTPAEQKRFLQMIGQARRLKITNGYLSRGQSTPTV